MRHICIIWVKRGPSRKVAPCDLHVAVYYTKQCWELYVIFTYIALQFRSSTPRRQNVVRHAATRTGFHERALFG